jgi:hypothetical protein
MQLGNFKRNYRYKSDSTSGRASYWIGIVIAIIAFILIWYYL